MAEPDFTLVPPNPDRLKRLCKSRPQKRKPATSEGLLFATGLIKETSPAVNPSRASTAQLLLPAPAVQLALPAPRPMLLLMAPPPDGSLMGPSIYLSPQGGRPACSVARRRHTHTHLHKIVEIISPSNAGEFRLYRLLLELCGTDYLASVTLLREEPFTITIGRAQLMANALDKLHGKDWRKKLNSREKAVLLERIKKEIKDATRGLVAKQYIDKINCPDETYHQATTYRVYISHQILERLAALGAVYWRAAGKGRILVDGQKNDIKTHKDDADQSE